MPLASFLPNAAAGWAFALLLALSCGTHAAEPPSTQADEAAGLFAQSCIPYAGDRPALQAWIDAHHLRALPPGGQDAFLHGKPGTVYDATTPASKLVVIAGADGSCLVASPAIDAALLTAALTRNTSLLGLAMELRPGRPEAGQAGFTWQEWLATKGRRKWVVTLGTGSGLAMLGAQPR